MTTVSDYSALLTNQTWYVPGTGVQPVVLTYSFSEQPTDTVAASNPGAAATFNALTDSARDTVRAALHQWSLVTGITFLETTAHEGDLAFGAYDLSQFGQPDSAGLGNLPNSGAFVDSNGALNTFSGTSDLAGDVYVDNDTASGVHVGGLLHLLLHEIGHALGLKHPFDGSTTLASDLDNGSQTVMAYNLPATDYLGPLDIQAIQTLYGPPGGTGPYAWQWDAATEIFTAWGNQDDQYLRGVGSAGAIIYTGGGVDDAVVTNQGDDTIFANGQTLAINAGRGTDLVVTGLTFAQVTGGIGGTGSFHYAFTGTGFQTYYDVETLNFLDGAYDTTSSTFTAAAALSVVAVDTAKAEGQAGGTTFRFTVTRTGVTNTAVSADWRVIGAGFNPAEASDFAGGTLPGGTVSFAAGETSVTVTVTVAGDTLAEGDEGFTVALSNLSTGAILGTAGDIAVIQNDDGTPATLSIAAKDSDRTEGNTGSTAFTFTVTRTGDTTVAANATWTAYGTGSHPVSAPDFVAQAMPTGTVQFAPGQTTQDITINIAGDIGIEDDETFAVTLAPGSDNTQIATATATGTIRNDDGGTLSGMAYHWKGHALLSDVSVGTIGSGHAAGLGVGTLEFRNVHLDVQGRVVAELWGNGVANATSAALSLDLPQGATALFEGIGGSLGGQSWQTTITAVSYGISTNWDNPLGASGQIGRITLTPPSGTNRIDTLASAASLGGAAASPFALAYQAASTGADGSYAMPGLATDTYDVAVSRNVSDLTLAITSADALSALRLSAGLNPNPDPDGAGPLTPLKVSPYQFIAADVTGDGRITSADALAILRMSAKLAGAKTPSWLLLDENMTFLAPGGSGFTVSRTSVPKVASTLSDVVSGDTTTNLVGVVLGDVNGSWRPLDTSGHQIPAGQYATVDSSYFDTLSTTTGAPKDLWGLA